MMKQYTDFYPNKLAKEYDFPKHLKNRERFEEYCLGKNEWLYKDEGNYGYERNTKHLTEAQRLDREYLWKEFNLWTAWQKSGRNIFDFSENLIELLKDTDVSDVELEHIKLPYPFFYMDISSAKIPFSDESSALAEGVYVSEEYNEMIDEDVTYERAITFSFTGDYIKNFRHVNANLYNHVRGFHSYTLFLDKPYDILKVGAAVKDAKDMFVKVDTWDDQDVDVKIDLYKIHSNFIEQTVKLVVNCLLYLTCKDKDIKENFATDLPIHLKTKLQKANTKKRKELALKEINSAGFTKIKFVGTNIQRPNKYDRTTGQVSPHWRRGHWRHQKFGEQLRETKLIWIMPTIVNKEKSELLSGHIYSVTEEKLPPTGGFVQ